MCLIFVFNLRLFEGRVEILALKLRYFMTRSLVLLWAYHTVYMDEEKSPETTVTVSQAL